MQPFIDTTGSTSARGRIPNPTRIPGDSDFENKFFTVLNDIGDWRAKTGRIESVDLRFNGEAVVNPDRTLVAQARSESPAPAAAAAAKPAHSAAPKKSTRHSR